VRKLRATGVGGLWRRSALNDVLLITPTTVVDGKQADWDKETPAKLAKEEFGVTSPTTVESGFSVGPHDLFVIVRQRLRQIVAADLMGGDGIESGFHRLFFFFQTRATYTCHPSRYMVLLTKI